MLYLAGIVVLVIGRVDCDLINTTSTLIADIYTNVGYDSRIPPRRNFSEPMVINVQYVLLNINDVDEVSELITTTAYLRVLWFDDQLSWNPDDYDYLVYINLPQKDIWTPPLMLMNSANIFKPLGDDKLTLNVFNDSLILWSPFQVFKSTCTMSITYFPFDIQTCVQTFVAWGYTQEEMLLSSEYADGVDTDKYSTSPSWELIGTKQESYRTAVETGVTITIQIQRKPNFVILTIVFPIMLLGVLNTCVFLLSAGDKIGYAMTIFLSFAVFLTIVQTTLPDNSDSTSVFSVYVISMTMMSTLTTIIVLVQVRSCEWEVTEVPIPRWVRGLARIGRKISCGFLKKNKGDTSEKPQTITEEEGKVEAWKEEDNTKNEDSFPADWKEAVGGIDALFFIAWGIYNGLCTVAFMVAVSAGSQANRMSID